MGFDVMSLNDPFIEFMWSRVNNDDSIARSEANIGHLESMSNKCAIKRRDEARCSFTCSWLSIQSCMKQIIGQRIKVETVAKRWAKRRRKHLKAFHLNWFRFSHWKIHYAPFSSSMDFWFSPHALSSFPFRSRRKISNKAMSDFFEYWSRCLQPSIT